MRPHNVARFTRPPFSFHWGGVQQVKAAPVTTSMLHGSVHPCVRQTSATVSSAPTSLPLRSLCSRQCPDSETYKQKTSVPGMLGARVHTALGTSSPSAAHRFAPVADTHCKQLTVNRCGPTAAVAAAAYRAPCKRPPRCCCRDSSQRHHP
jgi:hypothetical protein